MKSKRIVIIGMGDTGLLTAVRISRDFEVVGITTKPCMMSGQELGLRLARPEVWRPTSLIAFDRYRGLTDVDIIHGRATRVDPETRRVIVQTEDGASREVPYDALLIASGVSNGFWRSDALVSREAIEANLADATARVEAARTVAVIGGGPSGVSVAMNIALRWPQTTVHLCFGRDEVLPGYHDRTRADVHRRLIRAGVQLHPHHRARLPDRVDTLGTGPVHFEDASSIDADLVVWATGRVRPHSSFLPEDMLDDHGFVRVNRFLQVTGYPEIFAVGDIAATDRHRSSARNQGYETVAKNLRALLSGHPDRMRPFRAPPPTRWGSVFGLQSDGLRVYFPSGRALRFGPWTATRLVFPILVARVLFRGIADFVAPRPRGPHP